MMCCNCVVHLCLCVVSHLPRPSVNRGGLDAVVEISALDEIAGNDGSADATRAGTETVATRAPARNT